MKSLIFIFIVIKFSIIIKKSKYAEFVPILHLSMLELSHNQNEQLTLKTCLFNSLRDSYVFGSYTGFINTISREKMRLKKDDDS